MGQKTHPYGFRVGITKNWRSHWFPLKNREYADFIQEDRKIRDLVKEKLYEAGVSYVNIERKANQIEMTIYAAKPGIVVGKGGQRIDILRNEIFNKTGRKVQLNVQEIKNVELDAQIVSEGIALQLEKRVAFRRAMKQVIGRAMKARALGIKVMVAGRLGGSEIARTEWLREGRIPLQTLRADIDYGFTQAHTVMGVIGVKVWIFTGEIIREKTEKIKDLQAVEATME